MTTQRKIVLGEDTRPLCYVIRMMLLEFPKHTGRDPKLIELGAQKWQDLAAEMESYCGWATKQTDSKALRVDGVLVFLGKEPGVVIS
jgi:hypothetical protein